jgi:hypothetical protein
VLLVPQFITGSYADQHNPTAVNGFKVRLPDCERLMAVAEDMNIETEMGAF